MEWKLSIAAMCRRVLARFRRDRLEEELAEEIQLHLAMRTQALIDAGTPPGDAEAAARRQFGNVLLIREGTRTMWSFSALETMGQDVRYALRLLRRAPWFTAVAVASLAAGLGSAATIFTVADAVLWRTLPVHAPGELHEFSATIAYGAGAKHVNGVDANTLHHLRANFDAGRIVGFQLLDDVAVAERVESTGRRVRAEGVTDDYFGVLGVRAAAGRLLAAHDTSTAPIPIVLSERLWSDAFQRDPALINRALTLNGVPAIVIGVTAAFRGVVADGPADVFLPLASAALLDPRVSSQSIRVVARLTPDVSAAVAEQKVASILRSAGPSMMRQGELRVRLTATPAGIADARAPLTRPLTIGFLLAGILLLVSCANTGGLLVARFAARQGEFGLRAALGASRMRLTRQLAIEALLLSGIAAGAALILARLGGPLLLELFPVASRLSGFELRFDLRLIAFTAAAAGCAAFIAGGVSLIRALRAEPAGVLKTSTRSIVIGPRRLTHSLIALQVASSLLLVVAATSMTRTLFNLRSINPGFDPHGAYAVRVDASGVSRDVSTMSQYFRALHERLLSLPAIGGVTLAQFGFMSAGATTGTVEVPGFAAAADADRWVRVFWVGPGFFDTLRVPLRAGRAIDQRDAAGRERVAVVNEQFARFYFGSLEAALGKTINGNVRIVGIAADAHYDTLRDVPARAVFTPFTQSPPRSAMTFIVRPAGNSETAIANVLAAIRGHEPRLSVQVTSLADAVRATLMRERFLAIVALVLSCVGVFLSCAGLYAAVAYATAERGAELAVRIALGATRTDIVSLVLREPVRVALAGICIGLPGAYGILRAASSLLYGIDPLDIPSVAMACVVLIAAVAAAAVGPAVRAGRIDPLAALRAQ